MDRRQYLRCLGAAGGVALAGCTESDDEPSDDTPAEDTPADTDTPAEDTPADTDTPEEGGGTASAAVGERVDGDNLSMVVRDVSETTSLGEFTEADEGNVFVVGRLAVKNTTSSEFADFNSLLQTRLVDDEDFTYDEAITASTGQDLTAGQLAPGEVVRGDVVFEVPEDASGLELEFDFEAFSFTSLDRVQIDLTQEASSVADLSQDLAVDVHGSGDAIERGGLTAQLQGFETTTRIDEFTQADEGMEYAIVDVSVENQTGEDQSVSILLQMMLKDGEGFAYTVDLAAYSALDRAFEQGNPISDGQTRRGKIAYQVPEGTSPLYWTFEFDPFVGGNKSFWQVR